VAVAIGTIQNDVTMSGTVAADAAIPIKATLTGEVRKVLATPGQWVDAGTELLTLRAETMNPDGGTSIDTETVVAPTAGVLVNFAALVGQAFSVGDDVGKVAPPTFSVSGTLAPEQQYRLLNQPTEAQVTITGGPAPFTCTGLTISSATSSGSGSGSGDGSDGSGTTTVRCAIPADVKVFSGLTAQLVIAGGVAENVLIVPVTAVEGSAETGNVYIVKPDGSTESKPVTLGLNDGINVEVKDGLVEGDLVLQFIPGAPAAPEGGFPGGVPMGDCKPVGDGGMVCGG
jgi:multidrug efflux pump subunit AcrA (membrane-fusion protein)